MLAGVIMTEAFIRNLGFWMRMHEDAYLEGVEMAEKFIESIEEQKKADDKVVAVEEDINSIIEQAENHGINHQRVGDMFKHLPGFYKKIIDEENQEHGLPEAESY